MSASIIPIPIMKPTVRSIRDEPLSSLSGDSVQSAP
jgi:hypothetical protein